MTEKKIQKSVVYLGAEGWGATKAEARKDAERRIEESMRGTYRPEIIAVHGAHALIFREPLVGWQYALLTDDTQVSSCHIASGGTRYSIEQDARFHLAQNAWSPEVPDDRAFVAAAGLEDGSNLRSWIMWQRRYSEAAKEGLPSEMCREYANGHYGTLPVAELVQRLSNVR